MRTTLLTRALVVGGLAGLAGLPFLSVNPFWTFFVMVTLLQTMVLASLNLLTGYAGLISLGHNAFFAIGGYAAAFFSVRQGVPVTGSIALGLVFGALGGAVLAVPAWRARAVYFGIITLAFLFLTFETVSKWPALGGFRGFPNVPGLSWGGQPFSRSANYWFVLGMFTLAMVGLQQLSSSALGRSFVALRENEAAAESLGIGAFRTKLAALAVSGGVAGLAGALFAHVSGGIFPEAAGFLGGIRLFVALVVGGGGVFAGPVVGMGVVSVLDRLTVGWTRTQPLVFVGLLFVSLSAMRFYGIAGTVLRSRWRRLFVRLPRLDEEVVSQAGRPIELLVRGAGEQAGGPLLRVRDLTKRFGGVQALGGVDLDVEAGSIHGLIGPNGSGKTTFVNLVSGFIQRDGGRVEFGGRQVHRPQPHRMARAGLVRIFQRAETFGRLLVIENVLMGLHLRADRNLLRCMLPLPGRRRAERALLGEAFAILSAVGLAHRALAPAAALPYGEQRLLEVARAIAARPRLLILDEPATGLTAVELERLAGVLRALKRAGLTMLIIEHNMEFLMGLVDRVTVLDYGEKIAEGSPLQVQNDPAVLEAYLGEAVGA